MLRPFGGLSQRPRIQDPEWWLTKKKIAGSLHLLDGWADRVRACALPRLVYFHVEIPGSLTASDRVALGRRIGSGSDPDQGVPGAKACVPELDPFVVAAASHGLCRVQPTPDALGDSVRRHGASIAVMWFGTGHTGGSLIVGGTGAFRCPVAVPGQRVRRPATETVNTQGAAPRLRTAAAGRVAAR
jgi:hypothetical protein